MMPAKYFVAAPEPIEFPEGEDGPQICNLKTAKGKREYDRRKKIMWMRQLERCATCKQHTEFEEGQFGHGRSRGMGGSTRDDRIWDKDGKPMNAFLCGKCNSAQGSRKYEWREGLFRAVERERNGAA
jgi:hypothetical protein